MDNSEIDKAGAAEFGGLLAKVGDFALARKILTAALIHAQRCDAEFATRQAATAEAVKRIAPSPPGTFGAPAAMKKGLEID